MTAKAKAPNYTDEQVAVMRTAFTSAESDAERKEVVLTLSREFGKPVRSIVAKLANMKVYIKPEKVDKTGASVVKKEALADAIGARIPMTEADVTSLTKANKTALKAVLAFFDETGD